MTCCRVGCFILHLLSQKNFIIRPSVPLGEPTNLCDLFRNAIIFRPPPLPWRIWQSYFGRILLRNVHLHFLAKSTQNRTVGFVAVGGGLKIIGFRNKSHRLVGSPRGTDGLIVKFFWESKCEMKHPIVVVRSVLATISSLIEYGHYPNGKRHNCHKAGYSG